MTFQTQYDINPGRGFVGALARDNEPFIIDQVPAQVPSGGRAIRPGDQVYWDATNNGVAAVVDANTSELTIGIATYFPGVVAQRLSAIPSGANSDSFIEYADGAVLPVIIQGSVWLLAGSALEYGNAVRQVVADRDYTLMTKPTSFDTVQRRIIECVDLAVADTALFIGRIGLGRVF